MIASLWVRCVLIAVVTAFASGSAWAQTGVAETYDDIAGGLPKIVKVNQVTHGPEHHFFGYYAICPWDATGRYLACLETDFGDRKMEPGEKATIVLVDTEAGVLKPLAETSAWNFQQGALIHWLGTKPDREIIYNDLVDGLPKAVILDVHSGERRVLPRGITSVAPDGKTAACISFARLNTTRPGYGYPGVEDPYADEPHPKEDGLFIMDLATGESTLVASMDDAFHVAPLPEAHRQQMMWFNLVICSRDSRHVAFLCRYQAPKKGWYTSLFTVNVDGSELRCVIPYTWGCSHFDWVDADRICATTRLHAIQGCHCLFTNGKDDHRALAPDVITRDGHCHFSPGGRWMVTDSYPVGPERMQHLYVMDMATETVDLIGRFHEPKQFKGDWRCDLHPRWNRDGTKLCIDSTHDGTRQVYVLDLDASGTVTPDPKTSMKGPPLPQTVRLIEGKDYVGYQFVDEEYKGQPYLWIGNSPIEFKLPAREGQPHTLELLWGAKDDDRAARVTINGHAQEVVHGGYDGFKTLTIDIPAKHVPKDTIEVKIEKLPKRGTAAFIAEARLKSKLK